MCILFILRNKNNDWPLLIATNRDEFYDRDFIRPGRHWKNYPYIIAGKDKKAGGSWLGVNKFGLCVCILNRTSTIAETSILKSRGQLVIDALKFKDAESASENILKYFEKKFNFFNLFIADNVNAFWIKYNNFKINLFSIPYGYSIIDNLDLNDKESIRQFKSKDVFQKAKIPKPEINDFGDWEKMLSLKKEGLDEKKSSIYVSSKYNKYGTVCSSIIGIPKNRKNKKNIFWLYRKSLQRQSSFKKLKVFS